jgi:hypothetical protein
MTLDAGYWRKTLNLGQGARETTVTYEIPEGTAAKRCARCGGEAVHS